MRAPVGGAPEEKGEEGSCTGHRLLHGKREKKKKGRKTRRARAVGGLAARNPAYYTAWETPLSANAVLEVAPAS